VEPEKLLVSIVINSFNYGSFLEDTIKSVINQDYQKKELIIIDGGSTDNTIEILKKYEDKCVLKWVSEPDNGQSNAINKGFKMSKGNVIGWLDADDVYFDKYCLSYVISTLNSYPNVDVIYGNDVLIDENNLIFRARRYPEWNFKKAVRRFFIPQPATFLRRKVIEEHMMDENLNFAMDLEFFLKVGLKSKIKYENRIMAGTRIHKKRKSISKKMAAVNEGNTVIKKYGHTFGLSYYLTHFLVDFPETLAERTLGLSDLLSIKKTSDYLAFNGTTASSWSCILSQFAPRWFLNSAHPKKQIQNVISQKGLNAIGGETF
jgi:glycosyltransferase involved in cell wall biosynthesis